MLTRLLVGCLLMAACVTIHAAGVTWALGKLRRILPLAPGFWPATRLFIVLAVWIVVLHLVEISVWALAYVWNGAIADLQTAIYFSAVTYTTTGYGDVVLSDPWRLDAAVEALTGILMCGWSTGFFFAVVNRMYQTQATSSTS